jgi:hypothetical protein
MWIITHDNVHDESNPAKNVPRSRDYLERVSRKKSAERKHIFRLMCKGREMFRGVAYFENTASFKEILRPLDEFGRSEYDCDAIQYMVNDITMTPKGRQLWNPIIEDRGREIDQLIQKRKILGMPVILEEYGAASVCELDPEDIYDLLAEKG